MKTKSSHDKHIYGKGHRLSQILYTLSLAFLVLGLFLLAWVVWPEPTDAVQINIPPGPLPGAPDQENYASHSDYALNISWPRWIRLGEVGQIHLRLTDLDNTPLPGGEARSVQMVLVEPTLHPLPINPPGSVQANLGDDQELLLTWEVTGARQGEYTGKIFLSFGFFRDESPAENEAQQAFVAVPVAVIDLHVQVIQLWELDTGIVIWFGLVSLILWGVLFILGRVAAK